MDITFTPEEERFRAEARAWLAENAPQEQPAEHDLRARSEFDRAWQGKLFARATPASPGRRRTAAAARV